MAMRSAIDALRPDAHLDTIKDVIRSPERPLQSGVAQLWWSHIAHQCAHHRRRSALVWLAAAF
eukprot:7224029-Prymnesium_polylepis.1